MPVLPDFAAWTFPQLQVLYKVLGFIFEVVIMEVKKPISQSHINMETLNRVAEELNKPDAGLHLTTSLYPRQQPVF